SQWAICLVVHKREIETDKAKPARPFACGLLLCLIEIADGRSPRYFSRAAPESEEANRETPSCCRDHCGRSVAQCDSLRLETSICFRPNKSELSHARQTKRRGDHRRAKCGRVSSSAADASMPGMSWPRQAAAVFSGLAFSHRATYGLRSQLSRTGGS